jgi:hypothetical protein
MIEANAKRITALQTGHTRRGSPDRDVVAGLKQDRDALALALEALQ